MSRPEFVITGLAFDLDGGGLIVEYVMPGVDVRDNGLVRNHTLHVPGDDEFADPIGALQRKAVALLTFALAAFVDSAPVHVGDDEIDDEAPAPYDNPMERS